MGRILLVSHVATAQKNLLTATSENRNACVIALHVAEEELAQFDFDESLKNLNSASENLRKASENLALALKL